VRAPVCIAIGRVPVSHRENANDENTQQLSVKSTASESSDFNLTFVIGPLFKNQQAQSCHTYLSDEAAGLLLSSKASNTPQLDCAKLEEGHLLQVSGIAVGDHNALQLGRHVGRDEVAETLLPAHASASDRQGGASA
jgi:hypothetical protein